MKKTMVLVVAEMLIGSSVLAQSDLPPGYPNEVRGAVRFVMIGDGDFDLYDPGFGGELQYRNWGSDPIGWALSVGVEQFSAQSDSTDLGVPSIGDFGGDLMLIPVGASLLYKLVDVNDWTVILEGGLRYVVADSSIDFVRVGETQREDLDVDDGVIAVLGADVERLVTESAAIFFGVGYNLDVMQGEITIPNDTLKDNELHGVFVQLGARVAF